MCIIRLLTAKKIAARGVAEFLQIRVSALCNIKCCVCGLSPEKFFAFATRHTSVLYRIDFPVFSEFLLALKLLAQFLLKLAPILLVCICFCCLFVFIFNRYLVFS